MKKIKPLFFFFLLLLFTLKTIAQGVAYPLSNERVYNMMDRWDIRFGDGTLHTSLKPYNRLDATRFALKLDSNSQNLSVLDKNDIQYIFDDNNEFLIQPENPNTLTNNKEQISGSVTSPLFRQNKKPFLKYFYKTPANFFEIDTRYFDLKVNPIINVQLANAKNDTSTLFTNVRGIELRGSIDDRLWFYSNILESQANVPDYVRQYVSKNNALPGNGLYKNYELGFLKVKNGYDFLNAQAYVGFNLTSHIGMQIGHGRNVIGDGYRSLLLSDFSNNYFFLKINTRVWKFHYQNIFAELAANNNTADNSLLPKKYMALHHLSYNVRPNLNFGIFEGVIFARNNDFELQYLNPIIFYRSVEHALGSPDNVMLGLDGKWNFLKRFSLYGQFILDEFKAKEYSEDNWWAKKFGVQLGLKYINAFGVDHLDLQLERNMVRAFTYTHFDSSANYTHSLQPLAHPLGANLKEWIVKARYQPHNKLIIEGRLMSAKAGEDADTLNWGNNINLPYTTRAGGDFGYYWLKGVGATTLLAGLDVSFQVYHNMFLDFHILTRKKTSDDVKRNLSTLYIGGGFRMNIWNQKYDF